MQVTQCQQLIPQNGARLSKIPVVEGYEENTAVEEMEYLRSLR